MARKSRRHQLSFGCVGVAGEVEVGAFVVNGFRCGRDSEAVLVAGALAVLGFDSASAEAGGRSSTDGGTVK